MFRIIIFILFLFTSFVHAQEDPLQEGNFEEKLKNMFDRTEKSIKLVRDQIVESQNAPFLPELYMQLAELLTQKSNALYYLQMEKMKKQDSMVSGDKAFSPVVQTQKEAISIYHRVLQDFPNFKSRDQALFRLALACKSIDEIPEFIDISNRLLSSYPNGEEAMKVRLLRGQHHFENMEFDAAMKFLIPVTQVKFVYEKNLAKYRLGLIYIAKDKFKDALIQFEQVILDPELKEQDNPYNISFKTKSSKTDLKREALIDSIRAYTKVYEKNPDPIGYYSKLAPSEVHFQEVMEKLSVRYINMKKYDEAIKLLRATSERTADPQKIISIYQQVLVMIPIKDRINVPVSEIRFVLDKFNIWSSYFDIPKAVLNNAYGFFEKQVRDLGTTAHDYAKIERNLESKAKLLKRARDFYQLYIGFFDKTQFTLKMAINLADVYYLIGDYLHSGEYYLRIYFGEYGRTKDSRVLLENAILSLQKKSPGKEFTFYENVRMRGYLIKAIETYFQYDARKKNDPKLTLALYKAEYEQGFFPDVLEKLFEFSRKFKNTPQSYEAADLVLDYFNTRNEFVALDNWINRFLNLKFSNASFNSKLISMRNQAKSKVLKEKVKTIAGYDEFAQGKSYLAAALATGDSSFGNEVLKQALAKSKAERDIQTFLEAANILAKKESDPKKKSNILHSISLEHAKHGNFYSSLKIDSQMMNDETLTPKEQLSAVEEGIQISLMLRDWAKLEEFTSNQLSNNIDSAVKTKLQNQLSDLIDSPISISDNLTQHLVRMGVNDEVLLSLYKSQHKLSPNLQSMIAREISARCGTQSKQSVCKWENLKRADLQLNTFRSNVNDCPNTIEGIDRCAKLFLNLTTYLQIFEGSGESLFELAVSQKNYEAYTIFASFLYKASNSSPDLQQVLLQKSKETMGTANVYSSKCKTIAEKSITARFALKICGQSKSPTVNELFESKSISLLNPSSMPTSDPTNAQINELQKTIFASKDSSLSALSLTKLFYDQGYHHHAAAMSAQGLSSNKDANGEYHTLMGCSLIRIGLINEAKFHLNSGAMMDGLKTNCLANLNAIRGDIQ